MKSVIVGSGLLLLIWLSGFHNLTDTPDRIFNVDSVNVGEVALGDVIEASFSFESSFNTMIERVDRSCGCIDTNYPSQSVSSGVVKAKVSTDGLSVPIDIKRSLYVYLSGHRNPEKLSISARVVSPVDFITKNILVEQKCRTGSLVVKRNGVMPVANFKQITFGPSDTYVVSLLKTTDDVREYQIKVLPDISFHKTLPDVSVYAPSNNSEDQGLIASLATSWKMRCLTPGSLVYQYSAHQNSKSPTFDFNAPDEIKLLSIDQSFNQSDFFFPEIVDEGRKLKIQLCNGAGKSWSGALRINYVSITGKEFGVIEVPIRMLK
jgi:hypothetical protein